MRVDGRPVATGDRPGQLEAILDRPAHQRNERVGRRTGFLEQRRRDLVQRDEVAGGERRARVVERTQLVSELERGQAKQVRKLEPERTGVVRFGGDGRERPVQLFRASRACEGLQGVDAETTAVRIEGAEVRRPAHVRDPRPDLEAGRDLGDRSIGHAQKDELRAVVAQLDPALGEAGSHRGADATRADDSNRLYQRKLQFRVDTGHAQSTQASPLIEPIEGDDRHVQVTFVWRGQAAKVAVVGGPAGWDWSQNLMERVDGTDLWRRSYTMPRGLRAVYAFLPDPPAGSEFTTELWYSLEPDPRNPLTYIFPGDEDDPEWAKDAVRSVLEGPDAPPQPWIEPRPDVELGSTEVHRFQSRILGNERRVYVYTPPEYVSSDGPYPLLIVFDGFAYVNLVPTPTILDNLIAARQIPPLVAVMPDSLDQETRNRELACHPPFVEFLTEELLPWARGRWRITGDPARTTVAGSSFGGLTAAFTALSRPDVFGNVLSQSGAFGWKPEGETEPEWLIRRFTASPGLPLRFSLDSGLLEEGSPPGWTSILESNRRLRSVLEEKGYPVNYAEYAGGHDYICWQGTFADGLLALAPEPSQ